MVITIRSALALVLLWLSLAACTGGGGPGGADRGGTDGGSRSDASAAQPDAAGPGSSRDAAGEARSDAGSDGGDQEPMTERATIGPEGGTLTSSDGRMTITVPEGAVDADTVFTVAIVPDAPAGVRLGPAYELGPHDVTFNIPVTVALRYDPDAAPDPTLVVLDEETDAWDPVAPVEIDRGEDTLLTQRAHFSTLSYASAEETLEALGIASFEDAPSTIHVFADGDDAQDGFTSEPNSALKTLTEACKRASAGRYLRLGDRAVSYHAVDTIVLGPGEFEVDLVVECPTGIAGQSRTTTTIGGSVQLRGAPATRAIVVEDVRVARIVEQVAGPVTIRDVRVEPDHLFAAVELFGDATVENAHITVTGIADTHGIWMTGPGLAVRDSVIEGGVYGILAHDTPGLHIEDTVVRNTREAVALNEGSGVTLSGNTIRQNEVGIIARTAVTSNANTISCNTTVDVRVESGGSFSSTGDAWDHVPPAPRSGSDPLRNDYEGDVTAGAPVLAAEPCAAEDPPPAGPCEDVVSERSATIGAAGGVIHLGADPAGACTVYVVDPGALTADTELTLGRKPDDPSDFVHLPPDMIASETREVFMLPSSDLVPAPGGSRIEVRDTATDEPAKLRVLLRSDGNLNLVVMEDDTATGCSEGAACIDPVADPARVYVGNRHQPRVKPRARNARSLLTSFVRPPHATAALPAKDIADVPCEPSSEGCLDGGGLRYTELDAASCGQVASIEDELGLIVWSSVESGAGSPLAISHGFARDKGLRDAIDFEQRVFLPNRVIARDGDGEIITETPSEVWFHNPILDHGGATPLAPFQIRLVGDQTTPVTTAGAAPIALVSRPGTRIAVAANPTYAAAATSMSWLELAIRGPAFYGIHVGHADHVTVRNTEIEGFTTGLYVDGASDFRGANLRVRGSSYGAYVNASTHVTIDGLRAVANPTAGLLVSDSPGIRIANAVVTGSANGVVIESPGGAVISDLLALGNGSGVWLADNVLLRNATVALSEGQGIVVEGDGVRIERAVALGNRGPGFDLGGSAAVIVDSGASENAAPGFVATQAVTFAGQVWSSGNGAAFDGMTCDIEPNLQCAGTVDAGSGACAFGEAAVLATPPQRASFVGPTADPGNGSAGVDGTVAYAAITDWFGHAHPLSGFGTASTAAAFDCGALGACGSGETCQIYDFRALEGGPAIVPLPASMSGDDVFELVHVTDASSEDDCAPYPGATFDAGACTSMALAAAVELLHDAVGDDDGLCESGERCALTPHFGADQGLYGALTPFPFVDGQLTGVTLLAGSPGAAP